MHFLILNDVLFYNLTIGQLIFYFYYAALLVTISSFCVFLYSFFRPKIPARVNCWFCNRSFWVSYSSRNCFDCPFCDQYNGFTNDGDYNDDVIRRKMLNGIKGETTIKESEKEVTNGLCNACNLNQQLKVQQLASFTPMNADNYDDEVQHFKEQLEKSYRLCDKCNLVLKQTLQTQHYELLTKRLNGHCSAVPLASPARAPLKHRVAVILYAISICSLILVLGLALFALLPHSVLDTDRMTNLISQVIEVDFWTRWFGVKEISGVGTAASVCLGLISHLSGYRERLCLAVWGVVHAFAWTSCPTLLLICSLIGLILHVFPEKIFFSKVQSVKLTTASTFLPKKESLSDVINHSVHRPKDAPKFLPKPVIQEVQKKTKKAHREVASEDVPYRIETRSQSVKKQLAEADSKDNIEEVTAQKKRSRLFSPPPEVYEGFSSLRLASVEPEIRKPHSKPANYISESLNLVNNKSKSNLIKPAKFILKATGRVTPNSFIEEIDSSRSSPTCHESLSDINVSALSPLPMKFSPPGPYHFDYDYSPYSPQPGYLNPLPMGHTTVYTYTRPAPYPCSFTPQRFSPPCVSPCNSSFSPRFSEVYTDSPTGNLSSFSSLQTSQKNWVWIKRGIYAISVLFNVISMVFLVSSFWKN